MRPRSASAPRSTGARTRAWPPAALRSGEHIFALADTHPGRLLTVIPYDFYPETEWRDDMELGATELAIATRSRYYLRQAARWAHAYITGPNDARDTLNLYDVSGLAHYDLVRAMRVAHHPRLQVTVAGLLADLRRQLGRAAARGATDPFGFGFPWAQYDTASHGFGLAVEAGEYDQLTGSRRSAAQASRWLGNVLGANAWGISLAVGDGTTYPHCMQHQVANLAGSLDGSRPILAGAVVEGPNSEATTGVVPPMRRCPAAGGDRFGEVQLAGGVPRQRAFLLDGRAGHRSDRHEPARVRARGRGQAHPTTALAATAGSARRCRRCGCARHWDRDRTRAARGAGAAGPSSGRAPP